MHVERGAMLVLAGVLYHYGGKGMHRKEVNI